MTAETMERMTVTNQTLTLEARPLISNARARQISRSLRDDVPATTDERREQLDGLLTQYGVSLRDVEVLAALTTQESMSIGSLTRQLAMRRREVVWHVCRLIKAGLADVCFAMDGDRSSDSVSATQTGHVLSSIIPD